MRQEELSSEELHIARGAQRGVLPLAALRCQGRFVADLELELRRHGRRRAAAATVGALSARTEDEEEQQQARARGDPPQTAPRALALRLHPPHAWRGCAAQDDKYISQSPFARFLLKSRHLDAALATPLYKTHSIQPLITRKMSSFPYALEFRQHTHVACVNPREQILASERSAGNS